MDMKEVERERRRVVVLERGDNICIVRGERRVVVSERETYIVCSGIGRK